MKILTKLLHRILWMTSCFCLALLVGCNGCQEDETEKLTREELAKKREQQRDALIAQDLVTLPTDKDRKLVTVKPGHWHETQQGFKSTREDLQVLMASGVYYGNQKAALPATNFVNEYSRRTLLPKGQEKTLSLQVFIPPTLPKSVNVSVDSALPLQSTALRLNTELRLMPLMNPIPNSEKRTVANELKPYTFQLAVLSPKVLDYQYLGNLDAIRWASFENGFENERIISYDVALVAPKDNQYAFPHSMLTMTSMAVLIWDDVSFEDLSETQQTAIVDWVHWGGQLIISGPSSWSRLQESFLSPYLPITSGTSIQLQPEDFAALKKSWETRHINPSAPLIPIEIGQQTAGLKMNLSERGSFLPGTGDLVAEIQHGRGRIVVTGFSLREPGLIRWSYFSSFFSTGLLRRLPREIQIQRNETVQQKQLFAAPFSNKESEPQMHSNFRVLSRDLPTGVNVTSTALGSTAKPEKESESSVENLELAHVPAYEPAAWGGAGGWTDYSGVAAEAVSALRAAAGIKLPERATIVKLLAGYLICLVPLNWLIFKSIRRLEYAWIAAPCMSLIAVVVVGRVAQLDIGFARRATEIAILETHAGYPRGHLTQYAALYTSLSTNYTIEFPETDSVAMPMGDTRREMRRAQASQRELRTSFGLADGVTLEPMTVYSNSTEMLHAEQMVELGKPWSLTDSVDGQTSVLVSGSLPIKAAMAIRRNAEGQLQTAWLGDLASGQQSEIRWQSVDPKTIFEGWSASVVTRATAPDESELSSTEDMWIGALLHKIARLTPLAEGQVRLFGYTNQSLGQLKISPTQDQYDNVCLVVAHLQPNKLASIVPDLSIGGSTLSSEPVAATEQ